ncbi:MAG TPA: 2-phospho-L-lactate guanylyltransferase [Bellilinea sp.]|nr:2-phospho-L-lactate guanylyltransferase [Bellilinea sp.]
MSLPFSLPVEAALIWAIVPCKPFKLAKSRLASILTPAERQALSRKLFQHTLTVLSVTPGIDRILAVSADDDALELAAGFSAAILREVDTPGLNVSLERARDYLRTQPADALIVIPADLPAMQPASLQPVLAALSDMQTIVLASDRRQTGTNLMAMPIQYAQPFAFGDHSFMVHCQLAEKTQMNIKILKDSALAFDLDLPEDYQFLMENSLYNT